MIGFAAGHFGRDMFDALKGLSFFSKPCLFTQRSGHDLLDVRNICFNEMALIFFGYFAFSLRLF